GGVSPSAQPDLWRVLGMPGIFTVVGSQDRVHLLPDEMEESLHIKPMPHRQVWREILFGEAKEPHRGIYPPAILWMSRPLILLLQMDKTARSLDQTLEIIRVVRFGPQPEMLQNVVRLVIALLVPAAKETEVTGMLRDIVRRGLRGRAAQLFH